MQGLREADHQSRMIGAGKTALLPAPAKPDRQTGKGQAEVFLGLVCQAFRLPRSFSGMFGDVSVPL